MPSAPSPVTGTTNQIVTAIYPPSPSVTLATGVVSMTTVPPSVVYTVSSASGMSPHILPKPSPAPQPPADRQTDRHLAPERPGDRQADRQPHFQTDRQAERQTELKTHGQTDRQTSSKNHGSTAGSARPASPPPPTHTPGTWESLLFFLSVDGNPHPALKLD